MAFNRGETVLCINDDYSGEEKLEVAKVIGEIPKKGKTYTVDSPSDYCGCGHRIQVNVSGYILVDMQLAKTRKYLKAWCPGCKKEFPNKAALGFPKIYFMKIAGLPNAADEEFVKELDKQSQEDHTSDISSR